MPPRTDQIYEDYWSYTAAWTDLNGWKFMSTLRCCVDFFDSHDIHDYSPDLYLSLQQEVQRVTQISLESVRKGVNQLVKIGFLKPLLAGYVPEALEYLAAHNDRRRSSVLSKTLYTYGNFRNSMTVPSAEGEGEIQFLIKTLETVGSLDKRGLISLMNADIARYPNGFLTSEEIDALFQQADDVNFVDRKYNQIEHLRNLLGRLSDLKIHDGTLYLKDDADRIFGEDVESRRIGRDPYLQRVYKSELEDESMTIFQSDSPKCMLEGLAYPVLIASHIKPYSVSNPAEAFDVNNGLLLSKNLDSLFDLGFITFNADGTVVTASVLPEEVVERVTQYRLSDSFINQRRLDYMEYHRAQVFERRYNTYAARHYVFGQV